MNRLIAEGGIQGETRQAMETVRQALETFGASLDQGREMQRVSRRHVGMGRDE